MIKKFLAAVSLIAVLFCHGTQAQTEAPQARLFDEFADILASELIARLDNFAIQLQNEPTTKGFLVVYRTRRDLAGLSNRYAQRMRGYLVNTRGVAAERIVTVDGGVAGCLTQELWIVPPGSAPKPRPDAYPDRFPGAIVKFDEHGVGNTDRELYYWQDNFEELLEGFGLELQKHPEAVAYLVGYRGLQRTDRGNIQSVLRRERSELIKQFHLPASRIKTIDGGFREWRTVELWIAYDRNAVPLIASYRYARRAR